MNASITQMLRGTSVLASLADSSPKQSEDSTNKTHKSPWLQVVGCLLCIFSQFIQASQVVAEEGLLSSFSAAPLLVVGVEGFWGIILCCAVILPLCQIIPFRQPGSGGPLRPVEDSIDSLIKIKNSRKLQIIVVAYLFATLLLNWSGMVVTSQLRAIYRTVLDNLRSVVIWIVNLFVFYFISTSFGEKWTHFSFLQLFGFISLVVSLFIYNGVIHLPHRNSSHRLSPTSSESSREHVADSQDLTTANSDHMTKKKKEKEEDDDEQIMNKVHHTTGSGISTSRRMRPDLEHSSEFPHVSSYEEMHHIASSPSVEKYPHSESDIGSGICDGVDRLSCRMPFDYEETEKEKKEQGNTVGEPCNNRNGKSNNSIIHNGNDEEDESELSTIETESNRTNTIDSSNQSEELPQISTGNTSNILPTSFCANITSASTTPSAPMLTRSCPATEPGSSSPSSPSPPFCANHCASATPSLSIVASSQSLSTAGVVASAVSAEGKRRAKSLSDLNGREEIESEPYVKSNCKVNHYTKNHFGGKGNENDSSTHESISLPLFKSVSSPSP
ncbi:putative Solute carrier family 35 member F6 [Monocercomonoides exilis]|uniref:putative Solute carrier family 35 member F6 n=1 Tax=Monocercomonoides exilis TaxID=2049356 RepID=UPI00355AA820|nr:putative Solute carrier family 35 member F6 [Monocercomonoides exilis]|eukprot:MONOS_14531.1-p1 / transcript=MONOS_14531.1 / gene=MONOS_14531 / organism=Monocercomonoides_exilis_PA203 / gene_product=Transmembrane domain-containing protein / transcript_product=Transmembrane domain-containing protein / location=Mono_scaffold01019:7418-9520(-) / protein_length=556 / sequence_SO=supercontig / SO=protein_coding / is_pseudo=false